MNNEQQVKVVLTAEDKTAGAIGSASNKLATLSKSAGEVGKVMAGVAVVGATALAAGIYSVVKAAASAEVQMARVDGILNAMGDSAKKNRNAILEAADAAVKLGFDDEDAAESITKLYQRTNDLTKAQELNKLAMDLARAKNIELAQATDLVGMVLAGNGRALKAYGIELDETKTPLQALGELHDKVKGQAEGFADTFEGRMEIMNLQFTNLKETIGGALIEAAMPFMKQLSDWAARPDVQAKITAIAEGIGEMAKVVIPVAIEAIKLFYGAWKGIVEVLGEIIFRVTQAIEKIQAFVSAAKSIATGAVNAVKAPFRAEGGPVSAGSPYIVGERGPELFVPSSMGNIIPNGGFAGAGNITLNISGNTLLDGDAGYKLADQIMRALKGNMRI